MYSMKLQDLGADVVVFNETDGDIVQRVLDVKPDLVSIDIIIPNRDGIEVAKMLKADERTKDIPFVFLTNQGMKSDVEMGINAGARAYIIMAKNKPIEVAEILLSYCKPDSQNPFKLYDGEKHDANLPFGPEGDEPLHKWGDFNFEGKTTLNDLFNSIKWEPPDPKELRKEKTMKIFGIISLSSLLLALFLQETVFGTFFSILCLLSGIVWLFRNVKFNFIKAPKIKKPMSKIKDFIKSITMLKIIGIVAIIFLCVLIYKELKPQSWKEQQIECLKLGSDSARAKCLRIINE